MHFSALDKDTIERYSRQILLPNIGPAGQKALQDASILIIGLGGLGCPAALYLAAAGIGHLGLCDGDVVEVHNLHRQILHKELLALPAVLANTKDESGLGINKAASARSRLMDLNSACQCIVYEFNFEKKHSEFVKEYDVVVDATDNVMTRYLLNDACIRYGKPLVSASALRFEGQLSTYNFSLKKLSSENLEKVSSAGTGCAPIKSPCYRCIHPQPPPPHTITNCDVGGVVGPVVGILGSMQAMEVVSIITQGRAQYAGRMLLLNCDASASFDGDFCPMRTVKLRSPRPECPCNEGKIDIEGTCYATLCQMPPGTLPTDKSRSLSVLTGEERIKVKDLKKLLDENEGCCIFLDVRPKEQFEMVSLGNQFLNIPLKELHRRINEIRQMLTSGAKSSIVALCRRGNDSQLAVKLLKEKLASDHNSALLNIVDVQGGLKAYALEVEQELPIY